MEIIKIFLIYSGVVASLMFAILMTEALVKLIIKVFRGGK